MKMPGRTTVIVVAYHGDDWIPACVASLLGSLRAPVRLVLVDNAGNSCLEKLRFEGFDPIILQPKGPLGFAAANNFALQHIDFDAEAVCFLNQDTLSGDGWLEACVCCLRRHPQLGAVSPLVFSYDWQGWDPGFWDCARECSRFPQQADNGEQLDTYYKVPMVSAAAMVVRGDVLLKVGPFDPIFGSYYEDYDLCRRIQTAGYNVAICSEGRIAHFSGSATSSEAARRRRIRQIVRNRFIHSIRSAGSKRARAFLKYFAWRFPHSLGRSLWGTPSSQPLREYLGAHRDLLPLFGRLLSEKRDLKAWDDYLARVGWPKSDTEAETIASSSLSPESVA